MRYYPINLDIKNRKCLVVGGGGVGTRKVKTLLKCGALVTVISKEVSDGLKKMAEEGTISVDNRPYRSSDLSGMFLVIGATSDAHLNRRISNDAAERNMLCNIADVPEACNFILPAIVERGDLLIAVSTSGNSPAFAKKLRQNLEKEYGEEYTHFLQLMGAARKKLLRTDHAPEAHKPLFEKLIEGGLLDMVRQQRKGDMNRLLGEVLGEGFEVDDLLSE